VKEVDATGKLSNVFACFVLMDFFSDFVAQRSSDMELHHKVNEVFIGKRVHKLNERIHADQELECL
jgi:hypothetical protein